MRHSLLTVTFSRAKNSYGYHKAFMLPCQTSPVAKGSFLKTIKAYGMLEKTNQKYILKLIDYRLG